MKTVSLPRASQHKNRKASLFAAASLNVGLSLTLVCGPSISAWSVTPQQEKLREKLGSLTGQGLGDVYLNDSLISATSNVSSGDKIRTGESSEATLVVAGKGSLKISALSQIVLSGNEQYTAELEKGTVLLNSDPGSDGLIVRIGNYLLVPPVRSIATALRLSRAQDGSFLVSCLEGKIGVLSLESKSGQLLQAGQSLTVSAQSELLASSPTPKSKHSSRVGWILGLAGAGAGAAAAFAHHGGGSQTVTIP